MNIILRVGGGAWRNAPGKPRLSPFTISCGNVFAGRPIAETEVAGRRAVVPTITGESWIYGINTFVLDHDDPFSEGFMVGDIRA